MKPQTPQKETDCPPELKAVVAAYKKYILMVTLLESNIENGFMVIIGNLDLHHLPRTASILVGFLGSIQA